MTLSARLVDGPIDHSALIAQVSEPANGAILLFLGVVREVNEGRPVCGIEYSAYESMAQAELSAIVSEAGSAFGLEHIAVEHRVGDLGLQEASVGIAVAHSHRAAAYEASRWVLEALKQRVPIWKREHYVDGSREWVNPSRQAPVASEAPR